MIHIRNVMTIAALLLLFALSSWSSAIADTPEKSTVSSGVAAVKASTSGSKGKAALTKLPRKVIYYEYINKKWRKTGLDVYSYDKHGNVTKVISKPIPRKVQPFVPYESARRAVYSYDKAGRIKSAVIAIRDEYGLRVRHRLRYNKARTLLVDNIDYGKVSSGYMKVKYHFNKRGNVTKVSSGKSHKTYYKYYYRKNGMLRKAVHASKGTGKAMETFDSSGLIKSRANNYYWRGSSRLSGNGKKKTNKTKKLAKKLSKKMRAGVRRIRYARNKAGTVKKIFFSMKYDGGRMLAPKSKVILKYGKASAYIEKKALGTALAGYFPFHYRINGEYVPSFDFDERSVILGILNEPV